jgi:dephospho-CoA kinase
MNPSSHEDLDQVSTDSPSNHATPTSSAVLLDLSPSPWSVPLRAGGRVIRCAVVAAVAFVAANYAGGVISTGTPVDEWVPTICNVVGASMILRALWVIVAELLLWWSRRYVLTASDVSASSGIIARRIATLPVRSIRQIVVDRTKGERVLGMGTILISGAGSQLIAVSWVNVDKPEARAKVIREALDRACPAPSYLEDVPGRDAPPPIVLGLVGGIGAGKSAVAAALGELGCLVIDADRDARAALDRPDVREQLVRWWGPGILNAEGAVDRKAVASIVFSDPEQRARLEAVVHPIVKAFRGEVIARARAQGAVGVVIDAPLLFEAKSDQECDAVLFVDTPREMRVARVAARGWDPEELNRRERAQMSLEEKKARSHAAIVNDGDLPTLRLRVREVFEQLRRRHAAAEPMARLGDVRRS